jgi:fucokinase
MLDLSLSSGSLSLLRQGYLNNWTQYQASLAGQAPLRPWDLCVLTASNARQAEAYEHQIAARQAAGALPAGATFRVIPDPAGQRIGSGGATLRVLEQLGSQDALADQRVLVIHSGGDSRRLPHCSALGKLFARVPHELPDGRPSSLFDEFWVSLSGLPSQIPPGVLVASGDVLLLFDHLQLEFTRPGITGVAAAAPAETGMHHGVYVTAPDGSVQAFLHKPSLEEMRRRGLPTGDGMVPLDTGLVWLSVEAAQAMRRLAGQLGAQLAQGATINLYGDLLAPLAARTDRDAYLADASDGPATPTLTAARQLVWESLRHLPFSVECLQPAAFIHFGTTREYLELLTEGLSTLADCGWQASSASWLGLGLQHAERRAVGSNAIAEHLSGAGVVLLDSDLAAAVVAVDRSLISHVETRLPALVLRPGVVLDQIPLRAGQGWVSRLWGLDDNPKQDVDQGAYLGHRWPDWLAAYGLTREDLWPDSPEERSLWTAQLYPVCRERDDSLEAVAWLPAAPEALTPAMRQAWRQSPRLSLAASYRQADVSAMVAAERDLADRVAARRYLARVADQAPAVAIASDLGVGAVRDRRADRVADYLDASIDPWLPLRGYRALAIATGQSRWEERAFSALARLVRAHTATSRDGGDGVHATAAACVIRAGARIDLGGGWTDTPPYSLERGGQVLNAAIRLNGELPISVRAELLDERRIDLCSGDGSAPWTPRYAGEVLNYANPADPFALCKAALVLRRLVPLDAAAATPIAEVLQRFGHGLRLTTQTDIPRGSGLGTSSILAGAVLRCLGRLVGLQPTPAQLFDEVLCLEQMITTGGGWQDQIGGLIPGFKLVTTAPGLPQVPQIATLPLDAAKRQAVSERLVLIYTGQRRLAKNLLRSVMGRWMARDPEMVAILRDIAALAAAMRGHLQEGQLSAVGELLSEHWALNKRMDPGCTNPFIDELFEVCSPYLSGAKLAGAGGGGFAFGFTHDAEAKAELTKLLQDRYVPSQTRVWLCAVAFDEALAIG